MSNWTIFSNHGHVLLYLANDPDARLRDVAQSVGITERAVQKIVRDLQDGGIITISKHGRRNRYRNPTSDASSPTSAPTTNATSKRQRVSPKSIFPERSLFVAPSRAW